MFINGKLPSTFSPNSLEIGENRCIKTTNLDFTKAFVCIIHDVMISRQPH